MNLSSTIGLQIWFKTCGEMELAVQFMMFYMCQRVSTQPKKGWLTFYFDDFDFPQRSDRRMVSWWMFGGASLNRSRKSTILLHIVVWSMRTVQCLGRWWWLMSDLQNLKVIDVGEVVVECLRQILSYINVHDYIYYLYTHTFSDTRYILLVVWGH